jgi:rhamnosyl/mannosyltransferase
LQRADRIVVTSPQMRDEPNLLAGLVDKCRVIPLAANVEVAEISSEEVRRLRRKKGLEGRTVFLGVGRMVYYKGFEYAIEAMKSVDAELVLVGRGEDRERLQQKAQACGVDDRVHLPGYVSSEALSAYYSIADAFVFPSTSPAEAFGIVQVEAMAHGLPVVNTNLPTGVPFVSRHEETGLTVEPENSDALASALNRLLCDDALRQRLSANARERASKFSSQAMIDRYMEVYEEIR